MNNQILFGKTEIKSLSPPIFQRRATDDTLEILAEERLGRETEMQADLLDGEGGTTEKGTRLLCHIHDGLSSQGISQIEPLALPSTHTQQL